VGGSVGVSSPSRLRAQWGDRELPSGETESCTLGRGRGPSGGEPRPTGWPHWGRGRSPQWQWWWNHFALALALLHSTTPSSQVPAQYLHRHLMCPSHLVGLTFLRVTR